MVWELGNRQPLTTTGDWRRLAGRAKRSVPLFRSNGHRGRGGSHCYQNNREQCGHGFNFRALGGTMMMFGKRIITVR